jgi:DNA repair protein RadC
MPVAPALAIAADSGLRQEPLKASERTMSIRDWPESERPREKLLARGPQSLSDAELLAVLFGSGSRGVSAVELGRGLLQQCRSLRELLAGRESGASVPGLGDRRYGILQAALELARRHYGEALKTGPALEAPQATRTFLVAQLRDRPYEVFCCLHLNSRHQLIAFEELFRGTIDGASVHPREVVKAALARNAAAVILAHNHPSGVAEPSHADELITSRLRDALALVDIRVLDHLVIGDGRCMSFAERGLL